MYQAKKIAIGFLGVGILLGNFGGQSFAASQPTHTWNDGMEHKEENGISGDDFWLSIDHATTLEGNMTVLSGEGDTSKGGRMVLENSSIWNGNWKVEGNAHGAVELNTGSKWTGSLAFNDEFSKGLVVINTSTWEGSADITKGKYFGSILRDRSTWNGSMYVAGVTDFFYIEAHADSFWNGDLVVKGNVPSSYNVGSFLLKTRGKWRGRIDSDEAKISGIMEDDSTWFMTGDSKVTRLAVYDSEVFFMAQPGTFSTLTVAGDLTLIRARFRMNADLAANVGDLLEVNGTLWGNFFLGQPANQHKIYVNNQGSAWVNPSNELTIVKTEGNGGAADVQFVLGDELEVGGFKYGLKRVGNDWNLYTTGRLTTTASASLNAFVGSYLLNYAENQTLLKRLGDLRGGVEKNGVWARVYGGEFESRGNHFLRGFDMNYSGVQVGYDQKRGNNYFGGLFGYTQGNLDHGAGSGSVDSKSLGVYWTHLSSNGFYADFVLKYGWMNHDFKVLDSSGATIKGDDMNTDGWSGSLEVGKRIYLGLEKKDRWYLEPQAQLTVSRQNGDRSTASNGLQTRVDSLKSMLGRIGLNIGYEVKSGKNPIHLYGKVSYLYEFEGDLGVSYNGIHVTEHLGDNWWSYGVGATAQLGKNHRLYLDIERADGARFRQPWAISGGYRFSW